MKLRSGVILNSIHFGEFRFSLFPINYRSWYCRQCTIFNILIACYWNCVIRQVTDFQMCSSVIWNPGFFYATEIEGHIHIVFYLSISCLSIYLFLSLHNISTLGHNFIKYRLYNIYIWVIGKWNVKPIYDINVKSICHGQKSSYF